MLFSWDRWKCTGVCWEYNDAGHHTIITTTRPPENQDLSWFVQFWGEQSYWRRERLWGPCFKWQGGELNMFLCLGYFWIIGLSISEHLVVLVNNTSKHCWWRRQHWWWCWCIGRGYKYFGPWSLLWEGIITNRNSWWIIILNVIYWN